jgi:hypothetical protein
MVFALTDLIEMEMEIWHFSVEMERETMYPSVEIEMKIKHSSVVNAYFHELGRLHSVFW